MWKRGQVDLFVVDEIEEGMVLFVVDEIEEGMVGPELCVEEGASWPVCPRRDRGRDGRP